MRYCIIFIIISVLNQGDARLKPGNCPSLGLASACGCSPEPSECSYDHDCRGVLKCCYLFCDCRRRCVPPGDCYYNGISYLIGQTYPSADGCNTCICTADKKTSCTKNNCVEYP